MFTYGPVEYDKTTPRYASLDAVKQRLGITDIAWDAEITQAICAGELAMDIYWGRSLPDTGTDPQITVVPEMVKQAAENLAVAVFKETDAPMGQAGGDILGSFDFDDEARRIITRSPLLRGLQVTWGVA